jgi:hypothetical protein
MDFEQITDAFDVQVVSEMAIGDGVLVPLPREIIEDITAYDDQPKFATFLIESGMSASKRNWRPEILEKISEQINTAGDPVVGYLGHIKPDDDGFAFPEIQLHWLRSRCQRVGDKVRMAAKAYVLPEGKGRSYIARKLVRTVSISGKAAMRPIQGGGVDVMDFDLESIDLARPRKAGMRTALVGGLTSEMEQEDNAVKPEEIAALSANELRAHNPSLVEAIESEARKPIETKVGEQENEITELKTEADTLGKVREALGIDESADILSTVGEILVKVKGIAQDAKDKVLDSVLAEKFKDENTRGLVKLALASEMAGLEIEDTSDESKKKVTEMVETKVENNEILRGLVSEQSSSGASFQGKPLERGPKEFKAGYEDDNVKVRKARR